MLKRKQLRKQAGAAIFKIHIDFNSEAKEYYGPLQPGGEYRFSCKQNDRISRISYEEIVQFVTNVINNDIFAEYNKCDLFSVSEIKVIESYKGSIKILFSAIFNTLGVISNLKNLYDCVELIRELTNAYVTKRLESQYGDFFTVETWTVVPKEKMCDYRIPYKYEVNTFTASDFCKRDAFFYYLLVSNVVLLTIIILLVYKAVITVYC